MCSSCTDPSAPLSASRVRQNPAVLVLEVLFWVCVALIAWTQLLYALALAGLAPLLRRPHPSAHPAVPSRSPDRGGAHRIEDPSVSLIVAAHDEEQVIAAKVANALALDYPRERLQVVVACDGCRDATARRARDAGADLVLELP